MTGGSCTVCPSGRGNPVGAPRLKVVGLGLKLSGAQHTGVHPTAFPQVLVCLIESHTAHPSRPLAPLLAPSSAASAASFSSSARAYVRSAARCMPSTRWNRGISWSRRLATSRPAMAPAMVRKQAGSCRWHTSGSSGSGRRRRRHAMNGRGSRADRLLASRRTQLIAFQHSLGRASGQRVPVGDKPAASEAADGGRNWHALDKGK